MTYFWDHLSKKTAWVYLAFLSLFPWQILHADYCLTTQVSVAMKEGVSGRQEWGAGGQERQELSLLPRHCKLLMVWPGGGCSQMCSVPPSHPDTPCCLVCGATAPGTPECEVFSACAAVPGGAGKAQSHPGPKLWLEILTSLEEGMKPPEVKFCLPLRQALSVHLLWFNHLLAGAARCPAYLERVFSSCM